MTAEVAEQRTLDGVLVHDEGPVRVVTLNRPDVRNAMNLPMRPVLAGAIEEAHADPAVRAIVLTGAGSMFCSGGDVSSMQRLPLEQARERVHTIQRVARAVAGGPKPVIAAVEGGAFGAGFALAAACDRVVTASDARFAGSFTGIGLGADAGMLWALPQRIGAARTRQILMFGEKLDAAEALRIGAVDAVVEPGTAFATALADAARIAAGPPMALRLLKEAFADPQPTMETTLAAEVELQAQLLGSDDFAEGIAAFAEKRRPQFPGT